MYGTTKVIGIHTARRRKRRKRTFYADQRRSVSKCIHTFRNDRITTRNGVFLIRKQPVEPNNGNTGISQKSVFK